MRAFEVLRHAAAVVRLGHLGPNGAIAFTLRGIAEPPESDFARDIYSAFNATGWSANLDNYGESAVAALEAAAARLESEGK